MSMMGGLGGEFVELEAKEVRILLQSAVAVAPECLGGSILKLKRHFRM